MADKEDLLKCLVLDHLQDLRLAGIDERNDGRLEVIPQAVPRSQWLSIA
jgi:hypothetical protein